MKQEEREDWTAKEQIGPDPANSIGKGLFL